MTGYLTRDRAVIVAALLAAHYGRFMMKPSPGSRPSLQARLVAVALAGQAGRALAAGIPHSAPSG